MTAGQKLLGLGAVASIGVGLYFLFKRSVPQGSLPSEWALPSFTPTQQMLAPAPPPPAPTGTWTGNVDVAPIGVPCKTDAGCGAGLICINGSCRPESEWA